MLGKLTTELIQDWIRNHTFLYFPEYRICSDEIIRSEQGHLAVYI